MTRRPIVLLNEAALALPEAARLDTLRSDVIVAGRGLVALTLAELSLPGARMIWTDFRQSASLGRLHGKVEAAGGLDRLMLAADGTQGEEAFSVMCAVLCFLPALRRRPGAEVTLVLTEGPAVASLRAFLDRIAPRLALDGVALRLSVREAVA
jgi:hypothetical protein